MSDIDIAEQLRREADSCADVCCILRTANVMRTAADLITKLHADLAAARGKERERCAFMIERQALAARALRQRDYELEAVVAEDIARRIRTLTDEEQ